MKRVAFVGSKSLGRQVVEELFKISPDRLCGVITTDDSKDTRSALASFAEFSRNSSKPLYVLQKPSELRQVIEDLAPDLCLVVGWYWVIKPDLLVKVPNGWLGIHASLLPRYRGGSPLVWAMINGETETGLSLFYFDEGMDTGDIVTQKTITIHPQDYIADVLGKAERMAVEMIREVYPSLLSGTNTRIKQDHTLATYASLRKPADGRIDWSRPAKEIYNFVRAQSQPYPGAYCNTPSGEILTVWSCEVFPYPYYGPQGLVALLQGNEAVVTCGRDTAICLQTVQLQNQEIQDAQKVLRFGDRLQ